MGVMSIGHQKMDKNKVPDGNIWIKRSLPDRGWFVEFHGLAMLAVILMGSVNEAKATYAMTGTLGFENTYDSMKTGNWVTVSQFGAYELENRDNLIKYSPCINALSAAIHSGNRDMMEWVMDILGEKAGIIWDDSCQDALASLDYDTTDWFISKYPRLAERMKLKYIFCNGNTRLLEYNNGRYGEIEKRDALRFGLFGNSLGLIDAKFFTGKRYWKERRDFIRYLKANEDKTGIVLSEYDFLLQHYIDAVERVCNRQRILPEKTMKEIAANISNDTNIVKMAAICNGPFHGDYLRFLPEDVHINLSFERMSKMRYSNKSRNMIEDIFDFADRNKGNFHLKITAIEYDDIVELFNLSKKCIQDCPKLFADAIFSPDNLNMILRQISRIKENAKCGKSYKAALDAVIRRLMELNIRYRLENHTNKTESHLEASAEGDRPDAEKEVKKDGMA